MILAFLLSTTLSFFYFTAYIHSKPIAFFPYGLGTTSNTPFSFNISNLYTIGSYHNSSLFMASLYIFVL